MPEIKHASFALFVADDTGSAGDTACKGRSSATAEESLQVVHVLYTAFKGLWEQFVYKAAGPQRLMCGEMPVLEMKGAGVPDADIASRELLLQTVTELQDIHIKVVAVEILQNKKNWRAHVQWCLYEEIALDDWVTMYHGTDEQALQGIIVHGVAGRYTHRRACGGGVYVSTSFKVAYNFAREKALGKTNTVVLVLRCHLGRIKTEDNCARGFEDFIDSANQVCNSKQIADTHHYLLAEDAQILCQYVIKTQTMDAPTRKHKLAKSGKDPASDKSPLK